MFKNFASSLAKKAIFFAASRVVEKNAIVNRRHFIVYGSIHAYKKREELITAAKATVKVALNSF